LKHWTFVPPCEARADLENAQDDRAYKGERKIRGHDAELTDVRTIGHRKPPEVRTLSTITLKASDPFPTKKVSSAVRAPHRRGAQGLAAWLKSRENKALMSP
jgi:hypothetical protein